MNIVVCYNIKDVAMQLFKQMDQQMLDPSTTKEELKKLVAAQQSLGDAVRFLTQAIGEHVEPMASRR